jgi:hypothetical protein
MKRLLGVLLRVILGIIGAVVLAFLVLVVNWLARREDPAAFLPSTYVAYLQVPSLRTVYDKWLNLEAADVVLARPDLAVYRSVVADIRGLSLTRSPLLRTLLNVHADVMLLTGGKLVAVLDLGWRGIFSPLARIVGPELGVKGFSFLNDAGMPLYRYTTGNTTIQAAIVNSVAVVSLDADVVKASLDLRRTDTGLAATAGRDLLRRIRLRGGGDGLRILADTQGLSQGLLSPLPIGSRIMDAVEIPGQSILDVGLTDSRLDLTVGTPISVSLPDLAKALAGSAPPVGVTRYVPATATLVSVSTIAPLGDLYRIAAAIQGKDVQDIYQKADAGARSVIGMGIDDLLFSWVGAEAGMFMLPGSPEPVFFARISDQAALERSLKALTSSLVAGKDSSLVIDGVRIDRLAVPWYVSLILDTLDVNAPEPFFISRGGYFFLSLEAQNLAAVVKTADAGDNIASNAAFAELTRGSRSNPSLMLWYDVAEAEPFFLRGSSLLSDILRLYTRGVAMVQLSPTEAQVSLSASRAQSIAARPMPGFPLSPPGGTTGDVLAFRFAGSSAPLLAWIRGSDTVVLADAQGRQAAEATLEPDVTLLPEEDGTGAVTALWAVAPGGTVWRFGPRLTPLPPFPVVTGIASPMPPAIVDGRLVLFSKVDSTLVFLSSDGTRSTAAQKLDAPPREPPQFAGGQSIGSASDKATAGDKSTGYPGDKSTEYRGVLAFYPKSFDALVHLTDASGAEAPGWPVTAAGISWCAPRFVPDPRGTLVSFLTQAGSLHVWTMAGEPLPPFPLVLPGVFYATPEPVVVDGKGALAVLSQDGTLRLIGMDGSVLGETTLPDVDGRVARLASVRIGAGQAILVYGSGAFIAGLDTSLRPLPGFPLKGVTRPQVLDLNRDGSPDLVTAGLDGKIYAYAVGRGGA